MVRIFIPLTILSAVSLFVALIFGLLIDDPRSRNAVVQSAIDNHFTAALAALLFSVLIHAIILTYFMGTGRWIEETSNAYRLDAAFYVKSSKIKYRTIPWVVVCFALLLTTAGLGAAADPASRMYTKMIAGIPLGKFHGTIASVTILFNLLVSWFEFRALEKNGAIVEEVLELVRKIRVDRGLPVDG